MASVVSPLSPSSLQLRFGQRSAKPSLVLFMIRFRPSTRRILLVSASGGDGVRSQDSFAGWSGSEGGDRGGGDPKKNKDRFGGMLGAGLAAVFFTAGITFASLSLSSKATSGVKQQMEPLTTEQEVILTSDDQIEKINQIRNEASVMLPDEQSKIDDCNSGFQKGINKDFLSHMGTVEDSTGSNLDNIHHSETSLIENTKSNGNDADANQTTSNQDDLQIAQDVVGSPVPSTSSPTSPEFSSNDDIDYPSDAYSFKDSHNAVIYGSLDSAIEHDPNQSSTNHVDLFSASVDSTIHTNDHQEGNLTHVEMSLHISSEFEGQPQGEPSTSTLVMLESGGIVDSPDSSSERVNTASVVLEKEDIEDSDMLQLPVEASSLNPAVHDPKTVPYSTISGPDLDQNVSLALPVTSVSSTEGCILENNPPSVAYSAVVPADPSGNKPDIISSHSQVGRSSLFESALSEKPISYAGIPAPSLVSAALQVPPGKVLVPAVVDQVQGQALTALQVLKVIDSDAQPGDLCTRWEYARWLVSASSTLSRNTISKVYPAMYIENVTELAFDDVTLEDPDYSCIQGLAEAGIISSKLSKSDLDGTSSGHQNSFFSPESPVSRQDLVSWKMALDRRQLPEVDRNYLYQCSGYIDIDKIDKDAWPALVADLSAREQSITALAFGFTRLFQPNKPVTKAQAAVALATGDSAEVVGEELTRIEAESLAEIAVNAHTALVALVEKELNTSFEAELAREREKINSLEKLAEEARLELERFKAERAKESNNLVRGRSAVESEMEVLSRLRHEVEEQLQDLMSNKIEISFERDRISKLRNEVESENQVIVQLQYELEVERKALSMARTWAEEEAKRAREQARALEEARDRWERHGIKVVVDENLQEDASIGVTWLTAGQQPQVDETVNRAETLVEKLKAMASEIKIKSSSVVERIIQKILSLITALKGMACKGSRHVVELLHSIVSKASRSMGELTDNVSGFSSSIGDKARTAVEDCKESVEKFSQKFKT